MTTLSKALSQIGILVLLVGASAALAQGGGPAGGQQGAQQQIGQQQMAQQQMAQQQQLAQMDQTMQRLHQLEQQATQLSQGIAQRAGQAAAGQRGIQDQSMSQLCDSVASLARDMTATMDRVHQSLRDPALLRDPDLQRDMDRLRLNVEEMVGPLEESLKIMSRMQDRLHQPGTGN